MAPSRKQALQLSASLLFYAVTAPLLTRLVEPSGIFGALFVFPLIVITRQKGRNAGLLMGALGIVLNTAMWLAVGEGQQALHLHPVSALVSLLAGCVAFAALVIVLDRFFTEGTKGERLEHERALMQGLMDYSADSIWFKDLDGRFILANKATARKFGVPDPVEMNGKTDFDFFSSENAQAAFENERRIVQTGVPVIDVVERETWSNKPPTWVSITKMPLRDAKGRITGTFGISRDVTERRKMEESLRESEEHYRSTFMNAPIGFFHSTASGKLIEANPSFSRMMGYDSPEELISAVNEKNVADVLYLDPRKRPFIVGTTLAAGGKWQQFENQYRRKNGQIVSARITLRRYEHAGSTTEELEGVVEDITQQQQAEEERKKLQAQLLQAQKMEAVGRLAGGIAHDFNNILTAIYGYCDTGLLTKAPKEQLLTDIRQAAERAANLTSRLLAFSRGHAFQPRQIDLAQLVEGLRDMLKRLLGEDVELRTLGRGDLWATRADPAQVEQVIMNLVVNSRDAMPDGGSLTIETSNVHLGADSIRQHPEVTEGDYVMLAVSDTGVGMDAATLERIYEPFFTTKSIGKGTGLGLAIVYGIVKQNSGYVYCYSELGRGTTFKVYFPRSAGESRIAEIRPDQPMAAGGSETILFVDDDDAVRTIAVSVLETAGYSVTSAESGAQALAMVPSMPVAPRLVITDVVMPGLGGVETARRLTEHFPGIRVLYTSGYTENAMLRQGLLQESVDFLPKPFAAVDLLRLVRRILDG